MPHLPLAGEIDLFDRTWYNRAGVERVMGFCGEEEVEAFFRSVPEFERMLVRSGSVGSRSPTRSNISDFWAACTIPSSSGSRAPWISNRGGAGRAYTRAKEIMLERTHIPEAPWWIVQAVDKKCARSNCIHHLLSQFPYVEKPKPPIVLPDRERHEDHSRQPVPAQMFAPELY